MRYRLVEDFNYDNLLRHVKHVIEYKDDPRCKVQSDYLLDAINKFGIKYNQIADVLANSDASSALDEKANIVGYMANKTDAVKYNKETHDFVIYRYYSPRHTTKTLHKKTYQQYLNHYNRDFYSELPENIEDNDLDNEE